MQTLRPLAHGTVLTVLIGWLLYIGQTILVPPVLGAVIVYIIVGLAHVLARLPVLGAVLPLRLRNAISVALIALAFLMLAYLIRANKERALALAPQYQESLLASIQRIAVFFGIEQEPTRATLRQDLLGRIRVLLWVYYSAQIFLFGAEFTWVYAQRYGSHRPLARTD